MSKENIKQIIRENFQNTGKCCRKLESLGADTKDTQPGLRKKIRLHKKSLKYTFNINITKSKRNN